MYKFGSQFLFGLNLVVFIGQINEEKDKNLPKIPDPVPPEEAFGKGKRSRIPNKRYEALGIKTFGKSFLPVGLDHPG